MNGKIIAILVVVLAAGGGGAWYFLMGPGKTGGATSGNGGSGGAPLAVTVVDRALPKSTDSIVDPAYGQKLYEGSCAACHGYDGRGEGSAAKVLWRRPADLADGVYLNTRTDQDLMSVIADGGRPHARSRLMPDWITFHNRYEQLDLVAYIRTLHPAASKWLPNAAKVERVQSVLPVARVESFKGKLAAEAPWDPARDHTVDFLRALDGTGKPIGHAIFPDVRIGGKRVILCVAVGADGKISSVGTHQEVKAGDAQSGASLDAFFGAFAGKDEAGVLSLDPTPVAGAQAAGKALAAEVRKAYLRLQAGIAQDEEDLKVQASPPAPKGKGEELYRQSCAPCHGVLGNAKGKGITAIQPRPRNFQDGAYMNQPEVTRDYILLVGKKGGMTVNISSTMPAFETSIKTDEEWNAVVDFILTMPIPAKK